MKRGAVMKRSSEEEIEKGFEGEMKISEHGLKW
jgi:hypothetical protein